MEEKQELKAKQKNFQLEKAFEEIEEIIRKLESDDISLKESIALYGEGAKLLGSCKEELSGIEKEMTVIEAELSE